MSSFDVENGNIHSYEMKNKLNNYLFHLKDRRNSDVRPKISMASPSRKKLLTMDEAISKTSK